uniref:Secreted protein n=1 Tax=Arundo donax TaxID=35708 RepID=A0A0A9DW87_ARUDO
MCSFLRVWMVILVALCVRIECIFICDSYITVIGTYLQVANRNVMAQCMVILRCLFDLCVVCGQGPHASWGKLF